MPGPSIPPPPPPVQSKRNWLRPLSLVLLVVYWVGLFVATHIPLGGRLGGTRLPDKTIHFVTYAGLAYLAAWCFAVRRQLSLFIYAAIMTNVVVYGFLDEVSQIPIPGRYGDFWDWMADVAGGLIGLVLFALSHAAFRASGLGGRNRS